MRTIVKSGTGVIVAIQHQNNGQYPPVPTGSVAVSTIPTNPRQTWNFVTEVFDDNSIPREEYDSLTARQFKLGLVRNSITLASVEAAINAIVDPTAREEALIEWNHAVEFERMNPLVLSVSATLGLTPEQVDAMWLLALDY